MPELGKATYFVTMNTADFQAGAAKVEATTRGMASTVEAQSVRMGASFARLGQTALKFAGFAGIAALYFGIKGGTEIIKENDAALKQITSAIKTTGGAANVTAKHVEEMGLKWQRLTGIHAGIIDSTEAMLLRFTAVRNEMGRGNQIFDRTVTAVMNINAAMGKGLKPTLVAVGKAIQDPAKYLGMLARSGITFTAQQTKMIKALEASKGVLAAQKYVLSSLEDRYNGAAKAAGQSFAGQLARAKVALQDNVAVVLKSLIPSFIILVKVMGMVAGYFAKHQQLAKLLVLGFVALNASAIAYVVTLKLVTVATTAWTGVTKLATAAAWLFNAALDANPIVLTAAAVAALGIGLYELYKHFDTVRAAVSKFTNALESGLKTVFGWIKSHWGEIATLLAGPFAPIVLLASGAFGVRDALLGAMKGLAKSVEREAENIGQAFWQGIKNGLGDVKDKIKDWLIGPLKGAFHDVRSFFGIGSPSRWTHEMIGRPLAQGIQSGYTAELRRFTPRSGLVQALTPSVGLGVATRGVAATSAGAPAQRRHGGAGSRSDAYTLLQRLPVDHLAAQAGFSAPKSQMVNAILSNMGYAQGGVVHGPTGRDNVPAWLTRGEVVLAEPEQKRLMTRLGIRGDAHTLFKAARGYAGGGVVADDFHHRGGEGGAGAPLGSEAFPNWAIQAIVDWEDAATRRSMFRDYPMGRAMLASERTIKKGNAKKKSTSEQLALRGQDTKISTAEQHALDVAQRGMDLSKKGSEAWRKSVAAYIDAENKVINDLTDRMNRTKSPTLRAKLYKAISDEMKNRADAQAQLATQAKKTAPPDVSFATQQQMAAAQRGIDMADQGTKAWFKSMGDYIAAESKAVSELQKKYNAARTPARRRELYDQISGDLKDMRSAEQALADAADAKKLMPIQHAIDVAQRGINLNNEGTKKWQAGMRAYIRSESQYIDELTKEWKNAKTPEKRNALYQQITTELQNRRDAQQKLKQTAAVTSAEMATFMGLRSSFYGQFASNVFSGSKGNYTPGATHYASGGIAPGHGSGDTVPAMLTPGEVVLSRREQQGLGRRLGMPNVSPHRLFGAIQHFAQGGVVKFKDLSDDEKVRRIESGYRHGRMTQEQAYKAVRFWHLTAKWGDTHGGYDLPGKVIADAKTVVDPRGYAALGKEAYHHPIGTAKMLAKSQYEWYRHPLRSLKQHPALFALSLIPAAKAASIASAVARGDMSVTEAAILARANLAKRPSARLAQRVGRMAMGESGRTTVSHALLGLDRLIPHRALPAGPLREVMESDLLAGPTVGRGINNPYWAYAERGPFKGRKFVVKPLSRSHDVAAELLGSWIYEQAGVPGARNFLTTARGEHAVASLQIPGAYHLGHHAAMMNRKARSSLMRGSMLDSLVGFGDQHMGNVLFDAMGQATRIDFSSTLMGRHGGSFYPGSRADIASTGFGVGVLPETARMAEVEHLMKRFPPDVVEYLVRQLPTDILDARTQEEVIQTFNNRLRNMHIDLMMKRNTRAQMGLEARTATKQMVNMLRVAGKTPPGRTTIVEARRARFAAAAAHEKYDMAHEALWNRRSLEGFIGASPSEIAESFGFDTRSPTGNPVNVPSHRAFQMWHAPARRPKYGSWTRDEIAEIKDAIGSIGTSTAYQHAIEMRQQIWADAGTSSRRDLIRDLPPGETIQAHLRRITATVPSPRTIGFSTQANIRAITNKAAAMAMDSRVLGSQFGGRGDPLTRGRRVKDFIQHLLNYDDRSSRARARYTSDTRIGALLGPGTSRELLDRLVRRERMPLTESVRGYFNIAPTGKIAQIRDLIRTLRQERGESNVDFASLGLSRLARGRSKTAALDTTLLDYYSAVGGNMDAIIAGGGRSGLADRLAGAPPRGAAAAWLRPVRSAYKPPVKRSLWNRLRSERGSTNVETALFGLPSLLHKRTHGDLFVHETDSMTTELAREITRAMERRAKDKRGFGREAIANEAIEQLIWGGGGDARVYRNRRGGIKGLITYQKHRGGSHDDLGNPLEHNLFGDVYAAGTAGIPMFHDFVDHAFRHRAGIAFSATQNSRALYEKLGIGVGDMHGYSAGDALLSPQMVRLLSKDPLALARLHRRTGLSSMDLNPEMLRMMNATARREGLGSRLARVLKSERGSSNPDFASFGLSRLFGGKKFSVTHHEGLSHDEAAALKKELGAWPVGRGRRVDNKLMADAAITKAQSFGHHLRAYRDEDNKLMGVLSYSEVIERRQSAGRKFRPTWGSLYAGANEGGLDMFKEFIDHARRSQAAVSWGATKESKKLYEALGGEDKGMWDFRMSPRDVRVLSRDLFSVARFRKKYGVAPEGSELHTMEVAGRKAAASARRDRMMEPIMKYLDFFHTARGHGITPYMRGRAAFRTGERGSGFIHHEPFLTPDAAKGLVTFTKNQHRMDVVFDNNPTQARDERAYALGLLRSSREHYAPRDLPEIGHGGGPLTKRQLHRDIRNYLDFYRTVRAINPRPHDEAWEKLGHDVTAGENMQRAREMLLRMRYPGIVLKEDTGMGADLALNEVSRLSNTDWTKFSARGRGSSAPFARGGLSREAYLEQLLRTTKGRGLYRTPRPRIGGAAGSSDAIRKMFPTMHTISELQEFGIASPDVWTYLLNHMESGGQLAPHYRRALDLGKSMGIPMSPDWLKTIMNRPYKIPKSLFEGFAMGGVVRGVQTAGDTIPALLRAGEVVLNTAHQRSVAASIGVPYRGPDDIFARIQRFATADTVQRVPTPPGDKKEMHYHQNNTFNEIPDDPHRLASQMRIATMAAWETP